MYLSSYTDHSDHSLLSIHIHTKLVIYQNSLKNLLFSRPRVRLNHQSGKRKKRLSRNVEVAMSSTNRSSSSRSRRPTWSPSSSSSTPKAAVTKVLSCCTSFSGYSTPDKCLICRRAGPKWGEPIICMEIVASVSVVHLRKHLQLLTNYSGNPFERPPWWEPNPSGKATWQCNSQH